MRETEKNLKMKRKKKDKNETGKMKRENKK